MFSFTRFNTSVKEFMTSEHAFPAGENRAARPGDKEENLAVKRVDGRMRAGKESVRSRKACVRYTEKKEGSGKNR